jgi:hypothetical protein
MWSRYLTPKARRRLIGSAALAEGALLSATSIGLTSSGYLTLGADFEALALARALIVRLFERTGRTAPTWPR